MPKQTKRAIRYVDVQTEIIEKGMLFFLQILEG